MRPYRYAGAPPRRRPIDENKLVRDLHRVCRYVLGKHPVKHAPPSRVRYAAQMVLRYGSPGELTAILGWLARAPRRLPVRVGASAWAMGETGEPFEYLLRECPTGSRKSAATVNTSYPTFCISAMLSSSRSRCAFSIQRCS